MLRHWIGSALVAGMALGTVCAAYAATDAFDGTTLNARWTHRSTGNNDKFAVADGMFTWDLAAGQDLWKKGVDGAPFLLTDPPANAANFTIETMVNVLVGVAAQPPASQSGLILFREDNWTYTLWGPYAATDIRVEDCIDQDYRWRDQAKIGVDKKADKDVWLKIVKTGNELEFFYKDNAGDAWTSGGKDTKIATELAKGTYKIGLFSKSWGGSVAMKTSFDYFDSPELNTGGTAVDPKGKVAVSWGTMKVAR